MCAKVLQISLDKHCVQSGEDFFADKHFVSKITQRRQSGSTRIIEKEHANIAA